MNIRNAINFATKTKAGKTLLFLAGIGMLVLLLGRGKDDAKSKEHAQQPQKAFPKIADEVKPKTETSNYVQQRPFSPARIPAQHVHKSAPRERNYDITPTPSPAANGSKVASRPKRLPIRLYASDVSQSTAVASAPQPTYASVRRDEPFAPYGRLLQCELVLTLDSTSYDTPIVGLVTQDLWWNGKLLIPANSEVFGTAKRGRVRDRIGDSGRWVVVLASGGVHPAGTELLLNGTALDMDYDVDTQKWALTDGSAGIKGTVMTEANALEEVKFFAATALSAAANGLIPQTNTVFGQVPAAGVQTAGSEAASAVLDRYAERVLQVIEDNGYFTRVHAGKQFYLFIRQDLLMREARYAASTLNNPTATVVASRQNVIEETRYKAEVEGPQSGFAGLLSALGGDAASGDVAPGDSNGAGSLPVQGSRSRGAGSEMAPYMQMLQQATRPISLPNGSVVDPVTGSIRSN